MAEKREFDRLIAHLSGRVYNFAYRLAGNRADASDLVQEALEKALAHYESYDPHRSFESWLFKILQNIYLDSLRRYERRHTASLDAPWFPGGPRRAELLAAPESDPAVILDKKEIDALAYRALDRLPMRYRAVIVLRDIEGYSYREIAQIISCSTGTVRSRLHRARALLQENFSQVQS